jgi:hypothetical protein
MNEPSKSIFASVTFWGVVIGVVSQLATRYGYQFPGDISGLANDLAGMAGAALSIYGRIRATQPVYVLKPTSQGDLK